ncbi:RNA polymerase sigma factor [Actinocrispum wychmicini]|uniref:RNA polymerase sigma factor n=1 Tax=Actinocrispum wychmicini TaxID=1213861 RepID=UPI0014050E8E|nr:sigma-70 family RNA polymerase sigma factor [Actinocrispum wychmicini]
MTALSDRELVTLVQGDQSAYGELYLRHRQVALAHARNISRRHAEWEDLVEEAFVHVLARIQAGCHVNHFRAYLMTAIRNIAITESQAWDARWESYAVVDLPRVAHCPESIAMTALTVRAAFENLPERFRWALWLSAVEGWNPGHLSTLLGLSANTCAALMYRARTRFKAVYQLSFPD